MDDYKWSDEGLLMLCEVSVSVTHTYTVWTSANNDVTWHDALEATDMSHCIL